MIGSTQTPAPSRQRRRVHPALRALAWPQFRQLMAASILTMTAMMMQFLVRGWLVLQLTDSPFWVGLTAAAGGLPMLFFTMFGGVIADRFNRRTILVIGESVNLGMCILLAGLIAAEVVEIWHVLGISVVSGIAFSMNMPSRASMFATLVPREDVGNAIAMSTAMFSLSQIVGPALAGVLVSLIGLNGTLWVAAVALVPAIFLLVTLETPARSAATPGANMLQNFIEGFAYVRGDAFLRSLILLGGVVTIFAMPREALMPVFARDILHVGSEGLGLLLGASGIGALVASLLVAAVGDGGPRFRLIMAGSSVSLGLAVIAFALSPWFFTSLVLAGVAGLLSQMFFTSNVTLVQLSVPDELRGRVLSIRMVIFGLTPLGSLAAGAIAEFLGASVTIAIGGAICIAIAGTLIARVPALHRVQACDDLAG